MSLSPLRFLHVADACLDSPLRDIAAGFALTDDAEQRLESATLAAFEKAIDAALDAHVDFVILSRNTFVENDQSLAARIALLDGLYRLAEEEIRVFVLPGKHDPADAWKGIDDLPENVTIFFDRESEPVAVFRDGKVVATVAVMPIEKLESISHRPSVETKPAGERRGPYTVVLLTTPGAGDASSRLHEAKADYVALSGIENRQTIPLGGGYAHHPGGMQGLCRRQTGPHGCSLIEIGPDGKADIQLLPVAAVVRESIALVDDSIDEERLLNLMHNALAPQSQGEAEQLRIVEWELRGSGAIADSLLDAERRARLLEKYRERFPADDALHTFRILPGELVASCDDAPAADFFDAITSSDLVSQRALSEFLDDPDLSAYAEQLRAILSEMDADAIRARVQRLGSHWFRTSPTETL